MAMVNMNNLLNGKDSRWLQLEVCREFQRNKCSRPDTECKFAHPPPNVEVQNGRVTACYDSIKGRCNREKPPCKYFHPPQHLKDQLLINGRNHLALKNAIMQQMGLSPGQPLVPGQVPAVAANPYLTGMPQTANPYSPYFAPGPIMPAIMGPDPGVASPLGVVPQTVVAQQKMPRSDRLEMDVKSVGSFYYENFTFPGMVPYKRPAADKSGMPVYQPSATTYQQLMQLQQPFVPVSCEYSTPVPVSAAPTYIVSSVSSPAIPTSVSTSAASLHPSPPPLPASVASPAPSASPADHVTAPTPPMIVTSVADSSAAAALAKEVAQQNYAKAVKLAAANVSNSLAINPLTALSYTGVALNKHALSMPPPAASVPMQRYAPVNSAGLPFNFNFNNSLGLASPYATSQQQAAINATNQHNLLAFSRPPPLFNPYTAFLRPYAPSASVAPPLLGQGLLAAAAAAQYPNVQQQAVSTVQAVPTAVPAATTPNNNNTVVLQPYKKMKTT